MKKLFTVMLALMMLVALSVPVWADDTSQGNGPATVKYHSTLWSNTGDAESKVYHPDFGTYTVLSAFEIFGTDTIDGYVFDHWELGGKRIEVGSTLNLDSTYPHKDIYARWEEVETPSGQQPQEKPYSLTYDANLPTGYEAKDIPTDDTKYAENATATISETVPTSTYGDFLGWSINKEATEPEFPVGEQNTIIFAKADITLYAIWSEKPAEEPKKESYKVTYILDDTLQNKYILTKGDGTTYSETKEVKDRITGFGVWVENKETQVQNQDVTMTLINDCTGTKDNNDKSFSADTQVSVRTQSGNGGYIAKVNYATEGPGKGFGHTYWPADSEIIIKVSLHTEEKKPSDPPKEDPKEEPPVPPTPPTYYPPYNPITPIQPLPPDEPMEEPENPSQGQQPLPDDEHLEEEQPSEEVQQPLPGDEHLELEPTDASKEQAMDPDQPKTGDQQDIAMWITILLTAMSAMGLTIVYRRKTNN